MVVVVVVSDVDVDVAVAAGAVVVIFILKRLLSLSARRPVSGLCPGVGACVGVLRAVE